CVIVCQCPQVPCLRMVGFDGGVVAIGRRADKLSAQGRGLQNPGEDRTDEYIGLWPGVPTEVFDGGVVPADASLVCCEFLAVPILPEVVRKAFINTGDVGLSGRPLLSAKREGGI